MKLEKLSQELIQELDEIQCENNFSLTQIHRCITLCRNLLLQFKKEIAKNGFTTKEKEIHFFKSIKPDVLSKLLYYKELYLTEANFPKTTKIKKKEFLKKQLDRYDFFFMSHIDFGQYIEMNYTHFDEYYFTRKTPDQSYISSSLYIFEDPETSTPGSTLLAQFKAYGQLILSLKEKLKSLHKPASENFAERHSLKWKSNKIDLVELIYALHASGCIKDSAGIKDIAEACEELFDIKLGNFYRKFIELRNRKLVERTRFLDTLKNSLIHKMKEADN